jgi:hypothetical protein
MLKETIMVMVLILCVGFARAQDRYFTKTGKIEFYSKAPMEDIAARNKTVAAVLDTKTGALQFSVLMKGFEFEKALMQEHFNENYIESDKFPKGEFRGAITNNNEVNYNREGTYTANVKGKLTIHGVTKDVETTGTFKVGGGKIDANSVFHILLSDFSISIPAVVKDKVSNIIRIAADCKLEPLK